MSIDLGKNKDSILKAYNDVLSDKTATDWALFGYEGQSNVLKLVTTGEDGLEELADDLNSSKIMYAFVRVIDPKTSRAKFVLINWQGEGAPTILKGRCARHLPEVHKLLSAAHLTVNARNEEEVEPDTIMAAVGRSSATTYNFKERAEIADHNTPVKSLVNQFVSGDHIGAMGTNYKRTNPLKEIDSNSRNKFWQEQEAEERARQAEEQQRKQVEAKKLEEERKKREIADAKQRDALNKERNAKINASRHAEEQAEKNLKTDPSKVWEQQLLDDQREEMERSRRAEDMRSQRKKEAEALIGHATHSARALFESGATHSGQPSVEKTRPPPRKLKEFNPINFNGEEKGTKANSSVPTKGVGARWPPVGDELAAPHPSTPPARGGASVIDYKVNENFGTPPVESNLPQSSPPAPPSKQPPTQPLDSIHHQSKVETGYIRNLMKEGLPKRNSEDETEEQDWEETTPSTPAHVPSPKLSPDPDPVPTPAIPPGITTAPDVLSDDPEVIPALPVNPPPLVTMESLLQNGYSNGLSNPEPTTGANIYQPTIISSSTTHAMEKDPLSTSTTTTTTTHIVEKEALSSNPPHNTEKETLYEPTIVSSNANSATTPPGAMTFEVDGVQYQLLPEHGLCATALYDYQAADETEITFDPGDIITNIDQIDEGWWQGIGPNGIFGLFPANYVELIN
ncbi:actin binding protein 1 isoform X3 [Oratosquilla oratoria]|uniref:actin binding protein 1 isoform X3 n=1 Tax=Oratosquilla oratoria TaxID=337810 RepID=UPI003F769C36